MLSAIVLYEENAALDGEPVERMTRSLGSLVRASIEGLLRDVLIAGPARAGLDVVADHAGCGLIQASGEAQWLRAAIEAAREPHVLLLRAGFAPQQGFVEEAGDLLQSEAVRAAILRAAPERFLERLFPRLAPLAGLIAPRERCLRTPAANMSGLARALSPVSTMRVCARRVA